MIKGVIKLNNNNIKSKDKYYIENGIIYGYFNLKKFKEEGIVRYYIGQTTKSIEARAGKNGDGYYSPDSRSRFSLAIKKWGWDAFKPFLIMDGIHSHEELNEAEIFFIKYYNSYESGYNCTMGGSGSLGCNPLHYMSEEKIEELRKKMSISQKNRFANEEQRRIISETVKINYRNNPEIREKMRIKKEIRYSKQEEHEKLSMAQKERYKSHPEHASNHSKFMKKYFEDEENRTRVSENFKKMWEDEDFRNKQIAQRKARLQDPKEREKCARKGAQNGNSIVIKCVEFDKTFNYIGEAVKFLEDKGLTKINRGILSAVARGTYHKDWYGEIDGQKLHWEMVKDREGMLERFTPERRRKCVSKIKPVLLIDFNIEFESIKAAADYLKENGSKRHDKSSLRLHINNGTPYGNLNGTDLHWKYIIKENNEDE